MTAAAAIRKKGIALTDEQQAAYVAAVDFIEGDDREMVIAGAAGTDKTTVIGLDPTVVSPGAIWGHAKSVAIYAAFMSATPYRALHGEH
jgi:hypothetical protein